MDLVSSIRKSGSRGGVNFNWEDVATSNHRENYLGHSLKAPVGRWAKGKDLTWYAKAGEDAGSSTETAEEKAARERQEEIRKIKEIEEEALARALGLPVAPKKATGANAVGVVEGRGIAVASGGEPAAIPRGKDDNSKGRDDRRKSRRHDDDDSEERRHHRRRHRSRSRSRDRRRDRSPRRRDERGHGLRSSRNDERDDDRRRGGHRAGREDDGERRKRHHRHERSRSRNRSLDRYGPRREDTARHRPRSRDRQRSKSPPYRRQRSASKDRH